MNSYKNYLNAMGLFYSGDRTEYGLNYSSKSGESYDIWYSQWRHYSGDSGNTIESLTNHIEQNSILRNYFLNVNS